jgi:cell wall assembly regulator SMI1
MFAMSEALKKFWQEQRIILNPGALESELASFEAKYGVYLPWDFRSYLQTVNGFDDSEHWATDEHLITFLSLNEVKPLGEYWSAKIANTSGYFVFADYSISAHVYAIRLSDVLAASNDVVVVYDNPVNVANSFSEFIQAYMANNDAVLFPQPPVQQVV